MRKILLAFALFALVLIPSAYGMGSNGEHGMEKKQVESSIPRGHPHPNWVLEHHYFKIVPTSRGIVGYFKGKFLFSITFPSSNLRIVFLGNSLLMSSQRESIIVSKSPPTITLYFKESGSFEAKFVNLVEKNPSYYVFGLEGVKGVLVLIGSHYSDGRISGGPDTSAMISIIYGQGPPIPIGIMMKIKAQISIQEKEKGEFKVSVCSGSNFSVSEAKVTSFGIKLRINNSVSGLIEVSMPHNVSQGNVMVMYNGVPAWRAENPQELNSSAESFWTSSSDNSTLLYLKVPKGGTVYIVPHRKLLEIKALGIGIGSAISAGLLLVLFRRL